INKEKGMFTIMFKKFKIIKITLITVVSIFACLLMFLHQSGYMHILFKMPLELFPLRFYKIEEFQIQTMRPSSDYITPKEMIEDLNQLKSDLLTVHPSTIDGFSEETIVVFEKAFEEAKQSMQITNFRRIVSEVLATLGDSHTNAMMWSNRLPTTLRLIENRWYVISCYYFGAGSEVISIGGMPMAEIFQKGKRIISHENQYWYTTLLESFIVQRLFLSKIGVAMQNGHVEVVTEKDDMITKITFDLSYCWRDLDPRERENDLDFVTCPEGNDAFKYFINEEASYCLFVLSSSQYDRAYKAFLKQMLQDMKTYEVENMIIDLRGNTGGNSSVVVEFLRYIDIRTYSVHKKMLVRLSDAAQKRRGYLGNSGLFSVSLEKMKNRIFEQLKFNGSIYVLIDNATYSAGSDFATTLSDNKLATTIGRRTGGRPTSYGDLLSFQLNHSTIFYSISHKQFIRASKEKRYDDALYPDYEVIYTIEDILEGRDLDMKKALELIGLNDKNEK
ncbi:MAG: S41 family peptidase, partial [Alkaliphilus sp.]